MSVVIPYTFVGGVGNKARAAEVNADFNALAAKFTEGAGGIGDGDVSSTAGIRGSKLSSVPGNRITQAQMDDGSVDQRVLKSDATALSPNAAVNTANHIKDAIITNAKLVDATVKKGKLALASVTISVGAGPGTVNIDTGLVSSTAQPINLIAETSSPPAGVTPDMFLALDTATGKYWVRAVLNDAVTRTVRVLYLTI